MSPACCKHYPCQHERTRLTVFVSGCVSEELFSVYKKKSRRDEDFGFAPAAEELSCDSFCGNDATASETKLAAATSWCGGPRATLVFTLLYTEKPAKFVKPNAPSEG